MLNSYEITPIFLTLSFLCPYCAQVTTVVIRRTDGIITIGPFCEHYAGGDYVSPSVNTAIFSHEWSERKD
jgi:hypothetical protein